MAFVPLNTNNSNLANYNSVNSLMLDYQGFKKAVGTSSAEGWVSGVLPSVSSVTYNGNRSYDITFAGPVDSYLSPGMRLKTVRQVAAPTQCTSLNGTTQYWSKTSPAGLTFTTTFTCSAWVKLNSYGAESGIIARRNGDTEGWSFRINTLGQVHLGGLRIASNNKVIVSYQSIPLNKWVHVAATLDMAAGDTTAQKIWIDGVEVPRQYILTGTATALVQGTTALVVGAYKSAGDGPFPGKIAQAAVFSSQLSDATVKSYISQGLSGTETNLVSAFSFNGNANDLNTTNANNLTAQGSATATNADSPFSVNVFGTATGTDDYAIVQAVNSTVATVSLPAGCTIPTSGGISATYVSTSQNPFGWVNGNDKWEVSMLLTTNVSTSGTVTGTVYNPGGLKLKVPVGTGTLYVKLNCQVTNSTATYDSTIGVSTSSSTFNVYSLMARDYINQVAAASFRLWSMYSTQEITNTSATDYYCLIKSTTGFSQADIRGDLAFSGQAYIRFVPSGL